MTRNWGGALCLLLMGACSQGEPFARAVDRVQPMALPAAVPMPADNQLASLAQSAFELGDYGAAVRYYEKQARLTPKRAEVWLGLAASADRAGHFEISAPAYAQLLALAGPVFEYHNNLGFSYLLQGRYAQAEAELRQALALRPEDVTARNNLALLMKLKG